MLSLTSRSPFPSCPKPRASLAAFVAAVVALSGCQPLPYRPVPESLEVAVRKMTDDLLSQVKARRGVMGALSDASLVTDAVIDSDTGEATRASQRIKEVVATETRAKFPGFSVTEMTSQTMKTASYVINGVIHLEPYGNSPEKLTRLSMSVVDLKTGQVAAHSEAWVSDARQGFEPTPMYRDSPMYIKDRRVEALIATARAAAGSQADKEYFDNLATNALLSEAEAAYDRGNYTLALGLFAKAAERDDGKIMKTYSGLYESFLKLNREDSAEEAFASLVDLGIDNGNLSMKFLFESSKTDFAQDPALRSEYRIWLRQLAKKIVVAPVCTQIIGHASKSGTKDYNDRLSLERAKEIQRQLGQQLGQPVRGKRRGGNVGQGIAQKTAPLGRGFDECKKCTGDERLDAFDRRVEFNLVDCGNL